MFKTNCILLILLFGLVVAVRGQMLSSSPELLCTSNDQCFYIYGDKSRCEDGKCVCYTEDMKNVTTCIYKNQGHKVTVLGFTCETTQNCKPLNSICDPATKKCLCPPEFGVESADRKKCLKPLNSTEETCEDIKQCLGVMDDTVCKNGSCVCGDKFNFYNGSCIAKSKINLGCFNEGNCKHILYSECVDRLCRCHDGYLAKLDGSVCLPIADKLGDICTEHSQCEFNMGKGSQCEDKLCDCKEDFVVNENKTYCDVIPYVGKECLNDDHCNVPPITRAPETMDCHSGMCRCKPDHYQKDLKCFKNGAIKSSHNLHLFVGAILYHVVTW